MGPVVEASDSFRDIGVGLLALLSLALPFEFKNPLFSIGPYSVTSVEVCLYLTIAYWAVGWLAGQCRHWSTPHTIAAAWATVLIISACFSEAYGSQALKFALRSLGGCALFFAVSEFVCSPRSAAILGAALLTGSCLSAVAACAEIWLPGAANVLGGFKTEPTMSGGFLRASGTFQYANIASMYWEATLPLALTLPAWWGCRRFRARWPRIGLILCGILLEAIFLASSRAGILVAILILAACFLLFRHSAGPMRSLSLAGLIGFSLLFAAHVASGDMLWLRLTTLDQSSWYRADYEDFPRQLTLIAGSTTRVPLTIRNRGRIAWRARGSRAVEVTYHWLNASADKILIWNGARSSIPSSVVPGSALRLAPWIRAPGRPGKFTLQWDMLEQNMTWFSVMNPGKAVVEATVLPSPTGETAPDDSPTVDLPLPSQPARVDLWRAAVRMGRQHPLLGVGPDNFRRLYGSYLGSKRTDDRIYANNMALELFATVGLAGLSVFLALLVALFLRIRTAWRRTTSGEDKLIWAGIGLALAAFCAHGLVDYFLAFTSTYGLFWMSAGMAVGLGRKGQS